MQAGHRQRIEQAWGQSVDRVEYLPGGCVGEVWKVTFANGSRGVAKTANGPSTLDIEAYMLGYLARHSSLPIPTVVAGDHDLLLIDYIENSSGLGAGAEEDAADLLAALHQITADKFGHERDTLIGPLHQPNPWTDSWIGFFRDHRLMLMGQKALDTGRLTKDIFARLEQFCARLDSYLPDDRPASLIHGDIWGGNVLGRDDRIAAFIDPAIYHADAEIELAYTTLFNTFGQRFFARYQEHCPLEPEFFEVRLPIYHLYPLLVHACLFGGGYGSQADAIISRFIR